ncbi:MAG: signal recognition particle receptor subunit alpha [Candidatus Neomarinimicrobiota bacterium]|nr:signal recognition particle receptor subunit alpha [Candidatus Neomarinimicrobiota bacterium]
MLSRLFKALSRSRNAIGDAFKRLAEKNVTPESLEELQEQLLASDMGYGTVESIMDVVERHGRDYFLEKVRDLLI